MTSQEILSKYGTHARRLYTDPETGNLYTRFVDYEDETERLCCVAAKKTARTAPARVFGTALPHVTTEHKILSVRWIAYDNFHCQRADNIRAADALPPYFSA
tara:strand:- start:106 stop:411 length:306 start_codon:yes stop_codon:yes gene_type:complete